MVSSAAPDVTVTEARLGALYIRKTRQNVRNRLDRLSGLQSARIEAATTDLGSLDRVRPSSVPAAQGLVEVTERGKHLYVAQNDDLRAVAEEFAAGKALAVVANEFWTPNPARIELRFIVGTEFEGTSLGEWQLKLVGEKRPVFNWPVSERAA
jgi:hypothetical protein